MRCLSRGKSSLCASRLVGRGLLPSEADARVALRWFSGGRSFSSDKSSSREARSHALFSCGK